MFCRFCGAHVPDDSQFCAKCGKRLSGEPGSAAARVSKLLWLKTPYPWAVLLFAGFLSWALRPAVDLVDTSGLELELELQAETASPDANIFRQYLSLVVRNAGAETVRDVPVELYAEVVPAEDAEVVTEFRGGQFVIFRDSMPQPVVLVLSDEIAVNERRRFPIDSIVTAHEPSEVTYRVVAEDSGAALTQLSTRVGDDTGDDGPVALLRSRNTFDR